MVKANDSAFEAAKMAYTMYGWFLQDVAKQIGLERTVSLAAAGGDRMGRMLGDMVRSRCGQQKPDAASVAAVLEGAFGGLGVDYQMDVTDGRVVTRAERCPIYDGLAAAGLGHAQIQQVCQNMAGREYEQLKGVVPELTGKVKFRDTASDACVEELILAN